MFWLMVLEMLFHSGRKVMGETQVHIVVTEKQREGTQKRKLSRTHVPVTYFPQLVPTSCLEICPNDDIIW